MKSGYSIPRCAVCGKGDTWPYAISSGYPMWLCEKHKLKEEK